MKIALIFVSVIAVLAAILCILISRYGKIQAGKVECENTYVNFIKESLGEEVKLTIKEGRRSVASIKRREKIGHTLLTIVVYVILIILALIMILPFYWMIITSLKSNSEIIS